MDTSIDSPLMEELESKYPGAFEGWDGFEVSIEVRNRRGERPVIKVVLFNKGKDGFIVDNHRTIMLSLDERGKEQIRVGGVELAQEFSAAYIPEQYRDESHKGNDRQGKNRRPHPRR